MAWALICTIPTSVTVGYPNQEPYWRRVIVPSGSIVNMIAYDGVAPYTPPQNTVLREVPDTAKIGDEGYDFDLDSISSSSMSMRP